MCIYVCIYIYSSIDLFIQSLREFRRAGSRRVARQEGRYASNNNNNNNINNNNNLITSSISSSSDNNHNINNNNYNNHNSNKQSCIEAQKGSFDNRTRLAG